MFETRSVNDSASGAGYSITTNDDTLVGHVTVWGLSVPARIGTLAIIIGPEHQNNGYGKDAVSIILRLAFEEMGAHKIELQTWAYNERAIHVYDSLGFIEEGRRRAVAFHHSTFHDQVLMGMLVDEYRSRYV